MSTVDEEADVLDEKEASTFKEVWHQVAGHKGHGSAPGNFLNLKNLKENRNQIITFIR